MPDNSREDNGLEREVAHLQATLLVDENGCVIYANQQQSGCDLKTNKVIGQDWRELFAECEEVEIEADGEPDTFFFISTDNDNAAWRVRKWNAATVPGTGGAFFVIVESIAEPAAVDDLIYRERMISLGQMAAGVAHEVNNPLTTISGWLQILLAEIDQNDKRRAPLLLMNDETARIAKIIQHLLDFGRRLPAEQQAIRLNRLLADVLALVEYQMRIENVNIDLHLCNNLPLVVGDQSQFKQVFINVIVNARQAMPQGGTLKISTQVAGDGGVEVSFSDTGCGMSNDIIERIFDPFYTTKGESGSGIGLFLCRNIMKEHGGSLTVSSQPGCGSTFTIKLPAAQSAETPLGAADEFSQTSTVVFES